MSLRYQPARHSRRSLRPRFAATLVGAALVASAVMALPASASAAVSGVSGDTAGTHVRFTLTGANAAAAGIDNYEGTYGGNGPIVIAGSVHAGSGGYVTAGVQMGQSDSPNVWDWSGERIGSSQSRDYSASYVPTAADRAKGSVLVYVFVQVCSGGPCQSARVRFNLTIGNSPPPTVKAWKIDKILRIGKRYPQKLAVDHPSGKAQIHTELYEGGTKIGTASSPGPVTAKGNVRTVSITPSANRKGPLEFCVWAVSPDGVPSRKAPRSACKWIDVLVPIKNVSNQCGGAGWDKVVQFQNWVGNTSTFYDRKLREDFTVNFTDACNLHDAGYGGHTVRDILDGKRGKRPIKNFRTWSRSEVDKKFLADMRKICVREIPKRAAGARKACRDGLGRYRAVRAVGGYFFDADLRTPGTQQKGHRRNDGPLDAITWLP